MFWIFSFLLLLIALLFVLFPLWKHYRPDASGDEVRTRTNLAIFEERQKELQTELENGNLDAEQYQVLGLELKKSLLIDTAGKGISTSANAVKTKRGEQPAPTVQSGNETFSKVVPLLLALLIPVVAYVMYDRWGYLGDVQLMDLYERSIASDTSEQEASDLIRELFDVVQADPENPWPAYFLARNLSNIGRYDVAEGYFQLASELMPEGPDKAATLGLLAQIKYVMNGGEMTEEIVAVLEQARAINPSDMGSLQLLALDAENRQAYQEAIGYWRLIIQINPNSALAQQLRQRITETQRLIAREGGDEAANGPRIEVRLSLAEGLELPAELRVFVAARNAAQEGMPPLAAIDLVVADLPTTIALDNTLAITPAFNLSSAESVYVTATVSMSGSANVQSGDYRAVSQNFAHNGQHSVIELVISDVVP